MKSLIIPLAIMSMPFSLVVLSGSTLAWMAQVSGPEPTSNTLIQLADWTAKGAVGALLGFAGGVGLTRRNGAPSA